MKKILSILFSCCFFSLIVIHAQAADDSLKIPYSPKIKWNVFSFYYGVTPGLNIYSRDSASPTVAIPYGISFRHYLKHTHYHAFYNAEVSNLQVILDRNLYTSLSKAVVGIGAKGTLYNFQLNAEYGYCYKNLGSMYGYGINVELQSIVFSADFLKFFNSPIELFLVGFKVPLIRYKF